MYLEHGAHLAAQAARVLPKQEAAGEADHLLPRLPRRPQHLDSSSSGG